MGGVFGIVGEAHPGELGAMGERLAHRGVPAHIWSPAPRVHLGQLGGALDPEGELAQDAALPGAPELCRRLGVDPEAGLGALLGRLQREPGSPPLVALSSHFAIAWWDKSRERLVLLRDRFGARPLYAARSRGRFLFASEYKALLALADVPAEPDRDAIQNLQCTRYPKHDATFLCGVVPVARGCVTEVTEREVVVRALPRPVPRVVARSTDEHVAALRESFLGALSRQIPSGAPVGVQLSGGFDSSLVLGGVRAIRPDALVHTFTAGFGEDDPEVKDARALATLLGAVHHELILTPEQLPALLPRTVWHMEDPYGREDQVYLYLLARVAAKHVSLLLAGYAADMSFGGMPRHRLVDWALRFPLARSPLAELYQFTQTGVRPRGVFGRLLVAAQSRGRHFPVPRVRGTSYRPDYDDLRREGPDPVNAFLVRGMEVDGGWEALETLHAASGLTFDAPFMDTSFIELAFTIPGRLKIRGGVQKWVLREAASGLVPADVVRRRKTLQRLRHDVGLAEVLDALADEWLAPAQVRARGLFETRDIDRLRRRKPGVAYPEAQAHRLWTLLVTELWCRLFLDGRGKPPI